MRYMGLDLGTKTLGVSLSDPSGIIANALTTVFFPEGDYEQAAREAIAIVDKQQVGKIVLGHPKNMDGSSGFQARLSADFRDLLSQKTAVPVVLWDERLTTRIAHQTMTSAKTRTKDKKQKVDQLAATILLQSYLDSGK